jgi:hypothetical protein
MQTLGLTEVEYRRRSRNARTLGRVGKLAAGVAVVAAVAGQMIEQDKGVQRKVDAQEQEALAETTSAWNAAVVLREGAVYRTSPKTVNGNKDDGSANNIAGRIDKGQVMRIDRPMIYHESEGSDWLAFTMQKGGGKEETTDRVFWVHMSELEKQNSNDHSYIDVYNYPLDDSITPDATYKVSLETDGSFNGTLDGKGGPVGLASKMPTEAFNNMATVEALSLNHGK